MNIKRIYFVLVCSFLILFSIFYSFDRNKFFHVCPNPYRQTLVNPAIEFEGTPDENLEKTQVPISQKDRVPNRTGVQCVWSSIETLARYAEYEKLYDITFKNEYQSYAGPASLRTMLEKYHVKYEMTTNKKDRSLLLKGCMLEKRGVAFNIPGHMMVLVHYDEEANIVKYINNSDPQLKIRTWTMDEFNKRWAGWAVIIYADNDIIGFKNKQPPDISIKDRNNNQGNYQKDYIFIPFRSFFIY